ncbi:membrane protein insertase MisCA [Paenibacillus sp. J31TS4]|uniref:membrane protein insertase YidC n=1 Tax=Paenibacillus sp. J31TS4 TaxID=2807195 RepID=UPI001B00C7DA|nr:membrane protein insertase YidC [Paenibacillus sp. J31TS4]GIP40645.1 membrane protein insertase MisCA [Paenibacillus sp. J31TS4]
MIRRFSKLVPLAFLVLLLSACSSATNHKPIDPNNGIWDKFFVGPLSSVLDWFATLFGGSYGLSILIVTVIIRLLILPLTLKQYRSSKAMQAIQPELQKIREKHKDNPQKQQEETMKLFQQNNVNPLAGCFPLIIQMPILIALYNAIMRNGDIASHSFLWLKLGEADPYYILPAIAALTTFIQQKVMMATQKNNTMPMMQGLLFIFPVLIFVMSMNFPSALPLYWVFSNTFTIVQTYIIYRPSKK